MRPRGRRSPAPGSDVALRSAVFAPSRPRPATPRSAVVQTAVCRDSACRVAGVAVARSPYLRHPAVQGVLYGALIAAMTAVACVALTAASSAGSGWSAHAGPLLGDGPGHPGDARPRCSRAGRMGGGARGRRLHPAVLPRGRLPDRVARGVVAATALGAILVWGALLATAERLPEFMPSANCHGGCRPTRSGSWKAAQRWATRWRWPRVADGRGADRGRRGVDLPHEDRARHRPAYDEPDPRLRAGGGGTFAASAVARAGGAAPATLERLGWFSTDHA